MQNIKPIIRPVTILFLFFYVTVSYGSGCSKNSSSCKTCKATNSYGSVIEEKQVCTGQEEQAFRNHYAQAQTPVTVSCQ
jgi:hypothetical protein